MKKAKLLMSSRWRRDMTSTEFPVGPEGLPTLRDSLPTRIIASSLVALAVVLRMVAWTLWLSWGLEGAGAAINDTGRSEQETSGLQLPMRRSDAVFSLKQSLLHKS